MVILYLVECESDIYDKYYATRRSAENYAKWLWNERNYKSTVFAVHPDEKPERRVVLGLFPSPSQYRRLQWLEVPEDVDSSSEPDLSQPMPFEMSE